MAQWETYAEGMQTNLVLHPLHSQITIRVLNVDNFVN